MSGNAGIAVLSRTSITIPNFSFCDFIQFFVNLVLIHCNGVQRVSCVRYPTTGRQKHRHGFPVCRRFVIVQSQTHTAKEFISSVWSVLVEVLRVL